MKNFKIRSGSHLPSTVPSKLYLRDSEVFKIGSKPASLSVLAQDGAEETVGSLYGVGRKKGKGVESFQQTSVVSMAANMNEYEQEIPQEDALLAKIKTLTSVAKSKIMDLRGEKRENESYNRDLLEASAFLTDVNIAKRAATKISEKENEADRLNRLGLNGMGQARRELKEMLTMSVD
jgi:hypothetical protein